MKHNIKEINLFNRKDNREKKPQSRLQNIECAEKVHIHKKNNY
jgi:hypothetical protein